MKEIHPRGFKLGRVYLHPKHGKIYLEGGCYFDPIHGRLSNFWTYRKVKPDGSLSRRAIEGYGEYMKQVDFEIRIISGET